MALPINGGFRRVTLMQSFGDTLAPFYARDIHVPCILFDSELRGL